VTVNTPKYNEVESLDIANECFDDLKKKPKPEGRVPVSKEDVDQVVVGKFHTSLLAAALTQMDLCPIEKTSDLVSSSEMAIYIQGIGEMRTATDIEEAQEMCLTWTQALTQLSTSVVVAARTLATQNKRSKSLAEKEIAEQKKKQQEEEIERKQQEEDDARMNLEKAKTTLNFNVKWKDVGHTILAHDVKLNMPSRMAKLTTWHLSLTRPPRSTWLCSDGQRTLRRG